MLLLVSIGGYVRYCSFHPDIRISHSTGGREEHYFEPVAIIIGNRYNIPPAKSVEENLRIFVDENDIVVSDLINNYTAPFDVRSSGEIKDGKTIIRYEGTVTTIDGETKEYKKEMVFDFVLDPDMKF